MNYKYHINVNSINDAIALAMLENPEIIPLVCDMGINKVKNAFDIIIQFHRITFRDFSTLDIANTIECWSTVWDYINNGFNL